MSRHPGSLSIPPNLRSLILRFPVRFGSRFQLLSPVRRAGEIPLRLHKA